MDSVTIPVLGAVTALKPTDWRSSRRPTDVARDRTSRLGVCDSAKPQLCAPIFLITPQFPKLAQRLDVNPALA